MRIGQAMAGRNPSVPKRKEASITLKPRFIVKVPPDTMRRGRGEAGWGVLFMYRYGCRCNANLAGGAFKRPEGKWHNSDFILCYGVVSFLYANLNEDPI